MQQFVGGVGMSSLITRQSLPGYSHAPLAGLAHLDRRRSLFRLGRTLRWILLIQRQVQLQNIHARLTEESELAAFGVLRDQLQKLVFSNASGPGDAGNLKLGSRRSDMRIKAGARRCDQVHWDRFTRILRLQRRNIRSEEHTSELQSHLNLVCRLLLEKKKKIYNIIARNNACDRRVIRRARCAAT